MSIEQYREALRRALLDMVDETTGKKTWTVQDVAQIMKAQTDNALRQVMPYNTPQEYADILSM